MIKYSEFLIWLEDERKMSKRSAKDVVSRLKRVVGLLGSDTLDSTSVSKLNEVAAFDECTSARLVTSSFAATTSTPNLCK